MSCAPLLWRLLPVLWCSPRCGYLSNQLYVREGEVRVSQVQYRCRVMNGLYDNRRHVMKLETNGVSARAPGHVSVHVDAYNTNTGGGGGVCRSEQ